MRQHPQSRSQKRAERFAALIAKGQTETRDSLYKSEIKILREEGYTVEELGPHPKFRHLVVCRVIFPTSDLTEN